MAPGRCPRRPNIVRSVFAELVVTDLARARWFWVDVLGFVVTESGPEALYLRGYDELTHHNLILTEGAEPAAAPAGLPGAHAADLDRAVDFHAHLGCRTARLPAGTTPGIGPAVRAEDPLGFTVEFFHEAAAADRLQQRYDLRRGAEVARMDHFNIVVPDVQAAYEYYASLGFGLSETIEDAQTLYAAWMYRKQTVHDVAFTGGAGPRLHHLGFFAHETHQVLRICDILGSLHSEGHIERGPAGTGCPTPSTSTCAIRTATGWRSTPATTTPAIRITPCCAGTSPIRAAAISTVTRWSRPGTPKRPRCSIWTGTPRPAERPAPDPGIIPSARTDSRSVR